MPQSLDDHATRDDCDLVKFKLNSSTVSLAEEFDFEVVGHGGDFNWAQGHRTQLVKNVETQHDGIEHKNDRDVGEITSPCDSCSSSPAISLPSSPTIQKMVDLPECKVNVGTRGIVSKNRGIGITRKLATQKKKQKDSLPKKRLDRLRALRKPITDCLNAVAWTPYSFALYTTHVCFVAISIGLLFLLLVLFYRSLGNGKDQQIVIDQDFPVPTGIFTSNADITANVPAIYTLLEGWDKPDDIVYRFRISATDSDGKPRRQGLDYVSSVVTLTSLSSKEKNMPILLRARDDADGSYTFAVSVPGSGVESVVVDIYAATRAQIEKAGLKHAAGIGYRIEGSPFVIRGKVVNEKEHGKDPYKLFDGKSPPVFVVWQYIQNVMPRIDYRDLKSKIHARVTDVTARVRADAQLLNDRVFDELIAAKENVAAFMKAAVENLEQLVGSDEPEKGKGTKDMKNAVKKNAFAAAIQNSMAEFGDGVKRTYGNAKTGLEWLVAKIFSTRGDTTRSQTEPLVKKTQNGILKLGSFFKVQRKHIAEKTNAMGNELREKVGSSFVGMEKCVRDSILAVRRRVVATFTKGEESSWMKFRRAFSTFPGGLF